MRSTSQGGTFAGAGVGNLVEGDFEFVERVGAGFVDARVLAGGADEQAGEQIGQRRMILPEADQAAQQIGAAQERAVGGRGAADDDVIAAAGAGVAAVEHEFFGAEAASGAPVRRASVVFSTSSSQDARGLDVDFDDAGVGRDFEDCRCADRAGGV